MTRVNHCQNM